MALKEKLTNKQRNELSFNKRVIIKLVMKHNMNVLDEDVLKYNLDFIIPVSLGRSQKHFIYKKIYEDKDVDLTLQTSFLLDKHFVIVYTISIEDADDDEVHFIYDAKNFDFQKIEYYTNTENLEKVWQ